MRFADLAAAYERLEATSRRLEMRAILVELIRPLRPPDLARVLFLSQGMLRPEYEGVELGVADSLARRAVALSTGLDEATGEQKFELTVPASHEQLANVRRSGKQFLCASTSVTAPTRTIASRLFVNIDGFAYLAFTQNEWTLASAECTPGSVM